MSFIALRYAGGEELEAIVDMLETAAIGEWPETPQRTAEATPADGQHGSVDSGDQSNE